MTTCFDVAVIGAGLIGASAACQLSAHCAVPILKLERIAAAVLLPDVKDIDDAALLQGYLKTFRSRGGTLQLGSAVTGIKRDGVVWSIDTASGALRAKTLVNAAGA